MWMLDNLGVLSCLCNGSSAVADIGCVVHAVLLAIAGLGTSAWWEHVDSKANVSDGGTRESSVVATALGIKQPERALPPWPPGAAEAPPDVWLQWFQHRSPIVS
jgi:hypothetical protein